MIDFKGDTSSQFLCTECGGCNWVGLVDGEENPDPICGNCGIKSSICGRWVPPRIDHHQV